MTYPRSLPALVSAIALALLAAVGCKPHNVSERPPPPVTHVDRLVLPTSPQPVNWDQHPGADGLVVQVFGFRVSEPLPVTVKGSMEFLLYEGLPPAEGSHQTPALHTWRFSGDDLPSYLVRAAWGWGYAMRLGWGEKAPKTTSATLRARYVPPTGPVVEAKPVIIPVGPR
jgi:hypothetical protein